MAESRRNQDYLGIDSNVLIAYLIPEDPNHKETEVLRRRRHAVNPTVLHETYHTSVFKLGSRADETVKILTDYMDFALCLSVDSTTVMQGLRLALEYSLGGRDALILASYALSSTVKKFVTMDRSLLLIGKVRVRRKTLKIISLGELGK